MSEFQAIGKRIWAIAEGYIPEGGHGRGKEFVSHETACILNASNLTAKVEIMIYFKDREPAGPFRVSVPPQRTYHLRFNDLDSPERIPKSTGYSSVIVSSVPIVVQHTRLDSRQADLALMSTIAYSQAE